ncbi:ATP-binding cassette domain-containing protein [Rhodobacterales bacterium HKCCE4037]|nr:ATP-binding cassette domain-containing protein [Rhodobacterales bacterium HKCCE4037]
MLEVRGISVSYGQHRALEDVSARVKPGEIVVILGANGAGKSTLLKAISGICEGKVSGSVTLDGQELTGRPPHQIVEAGVALVPEGRGIFGDLTVQENLTLGAFPDRARDDQRANLDRVFTLFPKLAERRRQVARTMSGGEQQMVAIGRAMMSSPQILTLDEPSLGLSPLLCKELFRNLTSVRDLGLGVLLVEQNAKQSLAIADRGYLLENAHIVHEDTAAKLARDPAVQAAYLGAGAAAAPKNPEQAPQTSPDNAPAALAASALQRVELRPRPQPRQSADSLAGASIADLVARANQSAKTHVPSKPATTSAPSPHASTEDHGDRLRNALAAIERTAAAACAPERFSGPKTLERHRPEPIRDKLNRRWAGGDKPDRDAAE